MPLGEVSLISQGADKTSPSATSVEDVLPHHAHDESSTLAKRSGHDAPHDRSERTQALEQRTVSTATREADARVAKVDQRKAQIEEIRAAKQAPRQRPLICWLFVLVSDNPSTARGARKRMYFYYSRRLGRDGCLEACPDVHSDKRST